MKNEINAIYGELKNGVTTQRFFELISDDLYKQIHANKHTEDYRLGRGIGGIFKKLNEEISPLENFISGGEFDHFINIKMPLDYNFPDCFIQTNNKELKIEITAVAKQADIISTKILNEFGSHDGFCFVYDDEDFIQAYQKERQKHIDNKSEGYSAEQVLLFMKKSLELGIDKKNKNPKNIADILLIYFPKIYLLRKERWIDFKNEFEIIANKSIHNEVFFVGYYGNLEGSFCMKIK
jgi:hypothetical protein